MKRWRKIKTAPKDGTRVLLCGKEYVATGYYDPSPRLGNYPKWRWGLILEPTYWMPLTPAPRDS